MDTSDNLIGVQGRALDSESIRYITIAFDRTKPLAFGTDRIDWNRIFYVVEGPIDSMFLDNSLAVLGAGLVEKLSQFSHDKDRAVIVYDNEPRNPDIVRGLKKSIDRGYRTVIWPENWQYKDLNDYIQKTVIDPTNQNSIIRQTSILLGILEDHTFRGLQAQMEFTKWKKV